VLGIADREFARSIEEGVIADFARSHEIRLEEWRKRPLLQRGLEACAKVLIEQY
jgi:hypothetical protein